MSLQAGERIRVLIIDDIPETRENLRKLLSFDVAITVVGAASSGREGIELAKQTSPHVVLMDINMPDMDGIAATEIILQTVPTTQVVMLSVQSEADYMRRAMLAGARDFLAKPPGVDELMNTVHRVYEAGKIRAATLAPVLSAAQAAQHEGRQGRPLGEIVPVFSPKGGAGCTTIAVNLAIALKQASDRDLRIALVDSSLQFGDVGVMLNLQPIRNITDLLSEIKDLDNDMLNSALTAHGSGIKVMLAPPTPEAAETLLTGSAPEGGLTGSSALRSVLRLLREEFDIIVVDMWSWVDEIALSVFDAAILIILVVNPNIPSIKSARLFLELASQLNYPTERVALVVNGVEPSGRISVEQIEAALIPAAAQVPLDTRVAQNAANQGAPFVMRDRGRPISQAIVQLAEYIHGAVTRAQEAEEESEQDNKPASVALKRLHLGRIFTRTSEQQA